MFQLISSALLLFALSTFGQINVDLSGTVKSKTGDPLQDAIVTIEGKNTSTSTSVSGQYRITALPVKKTISKINAPHMEVSKDGLKFNLANQTHMKVELFNLNGKHLFSVIDRVLTSGFHRVNFPLNKLSGCVFIIRVYAGSYVGITKYIALDNSVQLINFFENNNYPSNIASAEHDTIRASKAGYKTARIPLASLSGTINFELDTLDRTGVGSDPIENGSADRIKIYGTAQYFWGKLGTGQEEPIVKITHAVSPDVVDLEVVFNPHFLDNTYGTGSVGWNRPKGHTFRDLHVSDHVELAVTNGNGDTVFHGRLDLLSVTNKVTSGYACLGPFGGDGVIYKGSPSSVVTFGSSLDDNINFYGYNDIVNSPATDSTYKANPDYPFFQYYSIYRLTLDISIFGQSGYGQVKMTSVHASPSKDGAETITVTEKGAPVPGTSTDPFRFIPLTNNNGGGGGGNGGGVD